MKLISDELKEYPEIEFKWFEKGLQFQVQFIKKDYIQPQSQPDLQPELQQELQQETLYSMVLKILQSNPLTKKGISENLGQKEISGQLKKVIIKLQNDKLIEQTIPGNPNHPAQKLKLTNRGVLFLKMIL